ncbi:MAG: hypothetical protein JNM90_19980 [Burkholderiales bacterium]|nr:hypothetical protein [Burkholderiales bacterium]
MSIAESIAGFCAYFERQVENIGRVVIASDASGNADFGAGSEFRYRKALYVTAIDTLAGLRFHKSAYPQLSRQNRERFTRFVRQHASWPEGDLVSLPFLKEELESMKLLARPLGRHVVASVAQFSSDNGGALPVAKIDEPISKLQSLVSMEREEDALREYQHLALLYRYRNSLVHESREPGNAMEVFSTSGEPYYHGYLRDPQWYLAYPPALFEGLLKRSIGSFREYLISNAIDPYSLVEDKARW